MNKTGSLCPTIKASEILGDKWTLLILRELFFGSTRYNEFQNAIPRISPTTLSARLKKMERDGLIVRITKAGQKGGDYRLTKSAWELAPIIDSLARWGLRWARDQLCDVDLDVGAFMWDFHRTFNGSVLPDGRHVFGIILNDEAGKSQWWVIVEGDEVDLCNEDPGHEVSLYITSTLTDMAGIWMGDVDVRRAIQDKQVVLSGARYLSKTIEKWFPKSVYADVESAEGSAH